MKKIFVLLLSFKLVFSQTNLVPNGGFETVSSCPPQNNPTGNIANNSLIPGLDDWQRPARHVICGFASIGTSDYHHLCRTGNLDYINGPRTGSGYTGEFLYEQSVNNCSSFNSYREYIVNKLSSKMIVGHKYLVEFYTANRNNNNSIADIGAYFSKGRPRKCCEDNINETPQILNTNGLVTSQQGWTKISGIFTPSKAYDWITIGNFNNNNTTARSNNNAAYYYFDDIKVVDLGTDICVNEFLIENTEYQFSEPPLIADNIIKAGYDVGATYTNGPVNVLSGADITYKSGNTIKLLPGFSAESGSNFSARIEPCDCITPNADAGNSISPCDETGPITLTWPYQLGTTPQSFVSYSWSANPPEGLNYLSNPNIANPTFTPPTGQPPGASVIYTLTATGNCGDMAFDEVRIQYESTTSAPEIQGVSSTNTAENPIVAFVEDATYYNVIISAKEVGSNGTNEENIYVFDGFTSGDEIELWPKNEVNTNVNMIESLLIKNHALRVKLTVYGCVNPSAYYEDFFSNSEDPYVAGSGKNSLLSDSTNQTIKFSDIFGTDIIKSGYNIISDFYDFKVKLNEPSNVRVSVLDHTGKVKIKFLDTELDTEFHEYSIETNSLANGIYYVLVRVNNSYQKVLPIMKY